MVAWQAARAAAGRLGRPLHEQWSVVQQVLGHIPSYVTVHVLTLCTLDQVLVQRQQIIVIFELHIREGHCSGRITIVHESAHVADWPELSCSGA